ncbi:hypothetical protein GCM10009751_06210 [Myceligenerans crystallogenes]|uniref:Uncharacterized protein n=1 Tax=Myceligenerans crystallogenes TaxID=316335 RepID=A0ABP4ZDF0_9MICO
MCGQYRPHGIMFRANFVICQETPMSKRGRKRKDRKKKGANHGKRPNGG